MQYLLRRGGKCCSKCAVSVSVLQAVIIPRAHARTLRCCCAERPRVIELIAVQAERMWELSCEGSHEERLAFAF